MNELCQSNLVVFALLTEESATVNQIVSRFEQLGRQFKAAQPISRTEQICAMLRDLIEQGDLPGGRRLPSTRSLGRYLGVSHSTVSEAYTKLEQEGFINLHVGRGAYVHHSFNRQPAQPKTHPDHSTFCQ